MRTCLVKRIILMLICCFCIFGTNIAHTNYTPKTDNHTKTQFKNIVFSGGGVLGIAYLGSLDAIDNNIKPLTEIKKYAGTSVGSIIATIASLRYTVTEMKSLIHALDFKHIAENNFSNFITSKNIFGDNTFDLSKAIDFITNKSGGYGINNGDLLEEWIENLIAKKIGKRHATFSDMKQNNEFAELYITSSDINNEKVVTFSATHTPDIVISKAVRASTSVPILFDVVRIEDGVYIDGGIYDLFPLDTFKEDPFYNTLGINFTNHHLFQNQKEHVEESFNWSKYIISVFMATFISQYNQYISSHHAKHVITINTLNIDPLNFNLTDNQKEKLMEEGYNTILKWIE